MCTLSEIIYQLDNTHNTLESLEFYNDLFQDFVQGTSDNIADTLLRLNSRLNVLENAITQILLTLEDINQYPDYMNFIMENFHDTNQVDTTLLRISNIDSENNTLTLEDVTGLIPYSYYTISDGVNSEVIQITAINRSDDTYTVILASGLENSYNVNAVRLYRSTTVVKHNQAVRSGSPSFETWDCAINWQGLAGNTAFTVEATPSVSEQSLYIMDDSIKITQDGYFSLSDVNDE